MDAEFELRVITMKAELEGDKGNGVTLPRESLDGIDTEATIGIIKVQCKETSELRRAISQVKAFEKGMYICFK